MSEDIASRQRRYLYMMGFRAVCFGITVVMVLYHFGWWAAFPAVFAIAVPYFAVVYANGGREPDNIRGFMEYRANLPARRSANGHGGTGTNGQAGYYGDAGRRQGGNQGGNGSQDQGRPGTES